MNLIWRKESVSGKVKNFSYTVGMAFATLISLSVTPAFAQKQIEKELSERRQTFLAHLVEEQATPSFATVLARYATNERIDEANGMLYQLLQYPAPDAFYGFNLMATYLYGHRSMPDSLREKLRRIFSIQHFSRGEGEHNHLMYYTTILLAAQTWPDMPAERWFNGKSSAANWWEALTYIAQWMDATIAQGQVQFDSPELLPYFIAPLELIHEFFINDHFLASTNGHTTLPAGSRAAASNLSDRASMLLDLLLIDFALEHIGGMYAGGHSYDTEPGVYSPRQSVSAALSWLYFGTGEMQPTVEAFFSALSGYIVPEAIFELATNRDPIGGYAHRERKRGRAILRNSKERNPDVFKYAYITQDYILASFQGELLHPMQQHTWDLTYTAPKDRHPTLFVMHPYYDPHELGSFFVDEPPLLLNELVKFKSRYNQPDKLVGGSPYEQIFQHRNVLIALYNIPEKVMFGHLNGFFSEDLQHLDRAFVDGAQHSPEWIFARAENTFIALRPLQPFRFEKMEGGLRFISEGRRNGVILEVSTPEESQTFEEFKRRVREVSKIEVKTSEKEIKIKYNTTYGDRMEFKYDGRSGTVERYFNDLPAKYVQWPLFENPFIKFDEKNRVLTLRVKNKWRVLDFLNWQVSERASSFTDELVR